MGPNNLNPNPNPNPRPIALSLTLTLGPSDQVWLMGPNNLKQLVTKWFKNHPTFAGLATKVG